MVIDSQTATLLQTLLFHHHHHNTLRRRLFGKILQKASIAAMIQTISRGVAGMLWDLCVPG
jgi:hypothetical protein